MTQDDRDTQREQFLAIVSHEMRTPLTSIISFSELIRGEADRLSPDGRRYLDIIERNADRLLALVSDLLMLTRIESGALPLTLASVDVPRLVADAVLAATPVAAPVALPASVAGAMRQSEARATDHAKFAMRRA